MPRRPASKNQAESEALTARSVAMVADDAIEPPALPDGRNPAAVMLGRLGGLVGGRKRAAALSPERRSEIARQAADARWGKSRPKRS